MTTAISTLTADDVITQLVEAATEWDALVILRGVRRPVMLEVADLLYVEDDTLSAQAQRLAIVREARA